jgi:hypothetical protein
MYDFDLKLTGVARRPPETAISRQENFLSQGII